MIDDYVNLALQEKTQCIWFVTTTDAVCAIMSMCSSEEKAIECRKNNNYEGMMEPK
jgi:hypothetical protein